MELASMAANMATGPSLLQSCCSLKAHPPFQILCDRRELLCSRKMPSLGDMGQP